MRTVLFLVTAVLVLGVSGPAQAGPPCICDPIDIGGARSLPWGERGGPSADYDRTNLVRDTLAILEKSSSPLVHMETIRRAVWYSDRNFRTDAKLMLALSRRAMNNIESKKQVPLVWFDAGYFAACLDTFGSPVAMGTGSRWIEQSWRMGLKSPEAELGAAFVAVMQGDDGKGRALNHVRRMFEFDPLEKNVLAFKNLRANRHILSPIVNVVEAERKKAAAEHAAKRKRAAAGNVGDGR